MYSVVFGAEIFILYILSKKLHLGFGRLYFKLTKSSKLTSYLLAITFLPGTFVHEVSHFLAAIVLLVPVGQIELVPEMIDGNKVKLGSVPVGKTDFVRRFLIGIAPMLFGIGIILFLFSVVLSGNFLASILSKIGLLYLVFQIANTMYMSDKDMEGFWRVLVLVVFVVGTFYLFGLKVNPEYLSQLYQIKLARLFEISSNYLLIPVLMDLCLIAFFRVLRLI